MDRLKMLGITILVILIGILGYYLFPKVATIQVQPKLIKQTTIGKLPVESHPNIFIVLLEYNTQTGVVTQLQSSKTNGDTPNYSSTTPQSLAGDFLYKIEVVDEKGKIVQIGWQLIPYEIIVKNGDDIRFRVITVYQQNATLKLYLQNNQLAWTGKMQ